MKLTELEPQFLRFSTERYKGTFTREDGSLYEEERDHQVHHYVDRLEEADGVMFLCPKCFVINGGDVGTHQVLCWFRGKVPDSATPAPGRWGRSGSTYDDLTLVPSVRLTGEGCGWHGFITNGDVTSC